MKKQSKKKIKWQITKDRLNASLNQDFSSAADFYIICEIDFVALTNVYNIYLDMPNSRYDGEASTLEQAIQRCERKILAHIEKSIKQLSKWV